MPAPFISVQDLIDYLGRGGTADPGMLIAIDSGCEMVRALTEQQVNQATETVYVDGTGTDCVLLPQLPVTAAGTVVVNGGTVTDYVLNDNGALLRGTAGVDPRPVWPSGRQNVRVTYQHGWIDNDIPRDIRMVALAAAARIVVQGVAKQESIGAVSLSYAVASTEFTSGEQMILAKYRQIR